MLIFWKRILAPIISFCITRRTTGMLNCGSDQAVFGFFVPYLDRDVSLFGTPP